MNLRILLSLMTTLAFSSAFAETKIECQKDETQGVAYAWCITQETTSTSGDILYYMHGGGGDENSWQELGNSLKARWAKTGFQTPRVINVSFGTTLLSDLPDGDKPGTLPLLLDTIMPALEAKIGGLKGQRLVMGPSLGGFNSAEVALRAPERFARAALLCPGIADFDPFLSDTEVEAYIARQPKTTQPDLVRGMVNWIRRDFVSKENWLRHDQLTLVKNASALKPSFFISCTPDDQYGFYNAAREFAAAAALKTKSVWVSIPGGGHCAQTEESLEQLADFMAGR